jgi:hypothetical protein
VARRPSALRWGALLPCSGGTFPSPRPPPGSGDLPPMNTESPRAIGTRAARGWGSLAGSRSRARAAAGNVALSRRIEENGLVVSEYDPGVEPAPWRFPARKGRGVAGQAVFAQPCGCPGRNGHLAARRRRFYAGPRRCLSPRPCTPTASSALSVAVSHGRTSAANGSERSAAEPSRKAIYVSAMPVIDVEVETGFRRRPREPQARAPAARRRGLPIRRPFAR